MYFLKYKRNIVISLGIFALYQPVFADAPVFDVDHYSSQQADNVSQLQNTQNSSSIVSPDVPSASESSEEDEDVIDDNHSVSDENRAVPSEAPSVSVDLKSKLEILHDEMQTLKGQVETLTHQLTQLQTQQRIQYMDLDKRLSLLQADAELSVKKMASTYPKEKSKISTSVISQQPNVAEEQQIYQAAYDLIKRSKYDQAITVLQNMLKKYPRGQFAANTHYWLGELYGLQGKSAQSATEFLTIVKQYPESPKLADAHYKLGLIYMSQENWSAARASFKKVINQYPGSSASRLALQELKQMQLAGH